MSMGTHSFTQYIVMAIFVLVNLTKDPGYYIANNSITTDDNTFIRMLTN